MLRRRRSAVAPAISLAVLAMIAPATPAAGVTRLVDRTFTASLGPAGANGTTVLTTYTTGDATISFGVAGLIANRTYAVRIYAGGCSSVGPVAVRLAGLRTDATGAAAVSRTISAYDMGYVWHYAHAGPIALRLQTASIVVCAVLRYPVATRVIVSGLHIDLPVIQPPGGSSTFPRCDVAMYLQALSQPGEPGVTFIYAHARTGMFLPLLTQSMINNGAALIGRLVYVYRSDSTRYTYKIIQVRRHVTSISSAFGTWTTRLWLQTSEGPYAWSTKLVVVAALQSIVTVPYADAHPTPHPRICY